MWYTSLGRLLTARPVYPFAKKRICLCMFPPPPRINYKFINKYIYAHDVPVEGRDLNSVVACGGKLSVSFSFSRVFNAFTRLDDISDISAGTDTGFFVQKYGNFFGGHCVTFERDLCLPGSGSSMALWFAAGTEELWHTMGLPAVSGAYRQILLESQCNYARLFRSESLRKLKRIPTHFTSPCV